MRQIFFHVFIFIPLLIAAQDGRRLTRKEYIETYKDIAMQEMERTGIPASITLAQGILESGDGNSSLARKGNNHFGIKCHDWKGKSMKMDDDARNECFRKYKSVEESYHDHSEFLTTRSRYAFLFEYSNDDYKAWAKGLKQAGYATSPTYSKALIGIIEDNQLHEYDRIVIARMDGTLKGKAVYASTEYAGGRKILYNNRVKYVLAREGDSFNSLSEELDLFAWQLPKYNDLPARKIFSEGEKVYLQPKRNKGSANSKEHTVSGGETLLSISQKYAVKLDKLAARNNLYPDAQIKPGDKLLLRGKKEGARVHVTGTPKIEISDDEAPEEEEFQIEFDIDS
jgi:LysM repeat protein